MDLDLRHFGNTKSNKLKLMPHKQMSRSNTSFLNFTENRKQKKELDVIRDDYFKRIDALPASDTAGRDALFAELEAKLKEKNATNEQLNEARNAKQKSDRGEKISRALNIFTKTTEALGIGRNVGNEMQNRSQGVDLLPRNDDRRVPIAVWIIGGAVVLGLGIFAIYKFRK